MFKTWFTDLQIYLLISGGICFLLSLVFHLNGKEKLSVILLVLTALFINNFAALLDPFLNIWDERFHALVAKNLMNHPLMLTLYDNPIVNTAYDRWDRYYIWLHKQPLFLWEIALCFKLFKVSEFTLRLPDVITGAFFVYAGYRSGCLLVNKRTGFIAAALIISSFYLTELISGRQELEHNDFSFLIYISLSLWSWLEYYYSQNKKWIYLIGLFSGFAILCKWLPGLLVYLGWLVLKLNEKRNKLNDYKDILFALIITILIALPWQIYIFSLYPAEAKAAYQMNTNHFLIPLDGHDGSLWFHFDKINLIYGKMMIFLIIPAFIVLYRKIRNKILFLPLLVMVMFVYLFYSFAATKMPAFTSIVFLIVIIAFASLYDYIFSYIDRLKISLFFNKFIIILAISILVFYRFDIESLQAKHTLWKSDNTYSRMLLHNREIFKNLVLPKNSVLFNVKGRHYVEAMFYTGFPSYNFLPTLEQYLDLKKKNMQIVLFKPIDKPLPDFLQNDKSVIVINKQLQGYD